MRTIDNFNSLSLCDSNFFDCLKLNFNIIFQNLDVSKFLINAFASFYDCFISNLSNSLLRTQKVNFALLHSTLLFINCIVLCHYNINQLHQLSFFNLVFTFCLSCTYLLVTKQNERCLSSLSMKF